MYLENYRWIHFLFLPNFSESTSCRIWTGFCNQKRLWSLLSKPGCLELIQLSSSVFYLQVQKEKLSFYSSQNKINSNYQSTKVKKWPDFSHIPQALCFYYILCSFYGNLSHFSQVNLPIQENKMPNWWRILFAWHCTKSFNYLCWSADLSHFASFDFLMPFVESEYWM